VPVSPDPSEEGSVGSTGFVSTHADRTSAAAASTGRVLMSFDMGQR
jgi:hypothetical protein